MQLLQTAAFALVMSIALAAFAVPPEIVPKGAKPLLGPPTSFQLHGRQMDLGKLDVVPITGMPFSQAMRIVSASGATTEWNIEVIAPTTADVKAGDVLLGHFWLRSVDSMTGDAYTAFEFQAPGGEFETSAELRISANLDWKECFIPFKAQRDFSAGQANVAFRAGFDRQAMEIGGAELLNFGRSTAVDSLPRTRISYAGREPDAPWRKAALDRIEKIRKGDLTILVTDSTGAPVPGAQVHAVLKRHAFGFGTCVDAADLLGPSPDDQKYRQMILSLFNIATFENEMKWYSTWDGIPPSVDRATQWLIDNHITVRGHNLVWPSWRWLPHQLQAFKNDPAELRRRTAEHITQMVSHYKGKLPEWDVVNEVYANHDLVDILGGRKVMIDWYNLAHAADPDCRLFINDFGIFDGGEQTPHRTAYFNTIKYLKDNGAPIGGIGIQSHFGADLPAPAHLLKVLDQFAALGLPIEATEVSLNLDDRQLQADYLRDYTIALFSHPAVHDVILWGFWAKRHWRPMAALFDNDWTPRLSGVEWIELTQKQFSTDATASADDTGATHIRGFYGTYQITASAAGKSRTVIADMPDGARRITVTLP